MNDYQSFIESKTQLANAGGFDPVWMPDFLFDFQKTLVEWSVQMGRSAIFADCGMGKTPMQLVWAQNVVQKTNKPVLLLTPLAVSQQTGREADKFGIETHVSRDGKHSGGIVITNYEMLHHFDPADFSGVVCDESSILKSYSGKTQKQISRFMLKIPYRLLCTATAAPNDYIELGTSSEALGGITHTEMLRRFFRMLDDKGQKKERRLQAEADDEVARNPNYYKKLSYRVSQSIGQYRLKHHAIGQFWRWVTSWAKACRKPSDLGFSDEGYILPELIENYHLVESEKAPAGCLFAKPAFGLREEREERMRTLDERCEKVASLVDHSDPSVIWCHYNPEGDHLEEVVLDSVQISGRTPDEKKIEIYEAFQSGQISNLIIKPKIGAWGLNWQHCNHVVTFPSHSYEQYYQSVRRCWRFGQERPVRLDVISTEGEERTLKNMTEKARRADLMFEMMIREMNDSQSIDLTNNYTNKESIPSWL
jgi:hypothetical protein